MTINSITQLEKLKTAISGLHERHPPAGVNVEIWRRSQHDLVRSRDNLLTGSILGFTFPAYRAVAQLSSSIRFACPDFKRGVNSEVALGKVSEYLLDNANTLTSKALTKIDLDSLETHWRSWLAQVGAEATHLVPCAIIPYPSASFRIGPVRFIQIEQLTSTDVCAKNDDSFLSAMEGLKKMLANVMPTGLQ